MRHGAPVRGIPEVLEVLARGFAAAGQGRHTPGPAAVAAWPAEVLARSPPLTGIPGHSLPIFGPLSRGCPGVSRRPYS